MPAAVKRYGIYGFIAVAILLPLMGHGYILNVDMIFGPAMPLPPPSANAFPLFVILHGLAGIIGAIYTQKIVLLLLFAGAGIGAHRLLASWPPQSAGSTWQYSAYAGGILYVLNPFTYDRFMAGQWLILAGYAALPWALYAWQQCIRQPRPHTAVQAGLWLTAVGIASLHILVMAGAAIIIITAAAWATQGYIHRRTIGMCCAAIGVSILLSSYWCMPLISGSGQPAQTAATFTAADQRAFATTGGLLGAAGAVLSMQGFWGANTNLYTTPSDLFAWWPAPVVAVILLSLCGYVWLWRHDRRMAAACVVCLGIGLVCAMGWANRLDGNGAFSRAFREPQKFVVLVVLAYCYGTAAGAYWLTTMRRPVINACGRIVPALPMVCAPLLPWGGGGQLHARNYPAGWYAIRDTLQTPIRPPRHSVLSLPWHLYMPYSFTSGVAANPMPAFFGDDIISSQDPELHGAHGSGLDTTRALTGILANPAAPDFSKRLASSGIRYVLLAKEYDYHDYAYLDHTKGVRLVRQTANITLYKVIGGTT